MAAGEARLEAMVKPVDALVGDELLERLRVGIDEPDTALVAPLELLQQLIGLLGEATRIDAENVDLGDVRPDDVGQHHGLGAQAVRVDHAPVLQHRVRELLPHRSGLLLKIEIQELSHGAGDYSQPLPGAERTIATEALRGGYKPVTGERRAAVVRGSNGPRSGLASLALPLPP